jgi:ankyrin repeat protein
MRARHRLLLSLPLAGLAGSIIACGKIGIDRRDEHGMTSLMYAAKRGDRAEVERLVDRGANVNATVPTRNLREVIAFVSWMQQLPESDIGYRPLHYAVQGGNADVVRVLIAKGADVKHAARGGTTALDLAIYRSDLASMTLLIDAGTRPTPAQLWRAVMLSTPETVALLLARGADAKAAPPVSGMPGPPTPPLVIVAIKRGDLAILELLVRAGVDVNAKDQNGWSALRWARNDASRQPSRGLEALIAPLEAAGATDIAGERGDALIGAVHAHDVDAVQRALSAGSAPNIKDNRGVPVLVLAARGGDSAIVAALVKAGANVHASPQNDVTPLISAIEHGSAPIVKELLSAGARADQPDRLHRTPLQVASQLRSTEITALLLAASATVDPSALTGAALVGNVELVRMLLQHGADPNANNGHALSEATRGCYRHDNTEAVRTLLDAGADPNLAELGALSRAAGQCEPETVRLLLAHRANPNARDLNGWTPLTYAVTAGRVEIVRILIAAGADVNARDDAGKNILAQAAQHPEVQEVLRQAGAR